MIEKVLVFTVNIAKRIEYLTKGQLFGYRR